MSDATMILEADGTAVDASPAVLDLLGVSLEQLRTLPPGAFAPEPPDPAADAAFREAWESQGSPDIGGQGTVKRLDGTKVRVRFAISPIDDGRFRVVLEPIEGSVDKAPTVFTAGQVLAEWRAAERQLTALEPDTAEFARVQAEIERFRASYQELFRSTARP